MCSTEWGSLTFIPASYVRTVKCAMQFVFRHRLRRVISISRASLPSNRADCLVSADDECVTRINGLTFRRTFWLVVCWLQRHEAKRPPSHVDDVVWCDDDIIWSNRWTAPSPSVSDAFLFHSLASAAAWRVRRAVVCFASKWLDSTASAVVLALLYRSDWTYNAAGTKGNCW